MNRFQISLDRIKKHVLPDDKWSAGDMEHLKTIQEALERQIPQTPLPDAKIYGNGICPNCKAYFLDKSTNYCGNCGQALMWSGND